MMTLLLARFEDFVILVTLGNPPELARYAGMFMRTFGRSWCSFIYNYFVAKTSISYLCPTCCTKQP